MRELGLVEQFCSNHNFNCITCPYGERSSKDEYTDCRVLSKPVKTMYGVFLNENEVSAPGTFDFNNMTIEEEAIWLRQDIILSNTEEHVKQNLISLPNKKLVTLINRVEDEMILDSIKDRL